ncbi:Non-specific protein-tyrosine kinase [Oleidesulfovibrio alaskensis G20]|jgi:exopolysaccharide/PEP-CTERM locus tyrosine autokinase|uniref:Non-specific protein-tyrosine kinase n=1 Tax=Oleidesulfovibrio alaskensis (strain ATCC BAA-1058 / DSM 17464 / G20) TaxID=207559 RepID=Q314L3_OLEA2|nr:XrtA-associated tyrosine autokinase [Oleidesulfovibrio alaskensis]ABB37633.1 Non-specific protein-tyrosine kinase [Oleidesulfovibrio alaskensis G20]MBG0773553.1 tyrosine-protein kinase family protein [Oleidesulfovibrio alaskensis]
MSRIEQALARARKDKEHNAEDTPPRPAGGGGAPSGVPHTPAEDSGGPAGPLPAPRVAAARQVRLSPKLVTATAMQSGLSEEYRKLKERLVKLTKRSGFQNMLMVTSALSREGKSLTSANLAISLAQEFDHTVLLIDADLRGPTCHELLGVARTPGLTDCLLDGTDVGEALVPTGLGRLSFLPAGRAVPNPGELFASTMMQDLLLQMKHRYTDRYLIIDTPPVLPFSETRSLSRVVDGVVMVVRENVATMEDLRESLEALEGATMLGVVYNNARSGGGRRGRYGYGYGYGGYGSGA